MYFEYVQFMHLCLPVSCHPQAVVNPQLARCQAAGSVTVLLAWAASPSQGVMPAAFETDVQSSSGISSNKGLSPLPKGPGALHELACMCLFRTLDISLPRDAPSAAQAMTAQQPEPHPDVLRDIDGLPNLQNPADVQPVSCCALALPSLQHCSGAWPVTGNTQGSTSRGCCLRA